MGKASGTHCCGPVRRPCHNTESKLGPRELLVTTSAEDGFVELSVKDHGKGFDDGMADRLFEPFFTTKPQGIGMGLAINRTIIEAHGGRIWAASNEDRGATFHFRLPAMTEAVV